MEEHKPRMSEQRIEKLREWHEHTYRELKKIKEEQKITVLGKELFVLSGIFAPIFSDSVELAKAVIGEVRQGDEVLDLGTGTGIQAIFAAEKAKNVLAVDINPIALKCAKKNVENLGLENKIEIKESNLFSNVGNQVFDLIIFDPPFRWFKPRDLLEKSELDENYEVLQKFFKQVKSHLKPNGRIILVFSNTGDIEYLKELIEKSGFNSIVLSEKEDDWRRYFVFKITLKV